MAHWNSENDFLHEAEIINLIACLNKKNYNYRGYNVYTYALVYIIQEIEVYIRKNKMLTHVQWTKRNHTNYIRLYI